MPLYEYVCLACKRRFEVTLSFKGYDTYNPICTHCQSDRVRRRIPRIRLACSEESHLEDLADPTMLAGLEEDPKAMGRMMRKMSREMGEDLGPEFDEVVGRLEAGQSPEDIEKTMPDLGEGMAGGMDAGGMDAGGMGEE